MEYGTFIRLVESEYKETVSRALHRDFRSSLRRGHVSGDLEKCVRKFKSWFVLCIRNSEVCIGDVGIHPEDAIVHAATKMSAVPPYGALHPAIHSVLSLFTPMELNGLFGKARTEVINKHIGSVSVYREIRSKVAVVSIERELREREVTV